MTQSKFRESMIVNKSYKLHSPRIQQLRDSIISNNTKTKTRTQVKKQMLPYVNNSALSNRKQQKLLSAQNRHLRYLFHQFCKQSYIGGAHATFDQISHSSQIMTSNKWMTFCKQFELTSKLSNRQAYRIFKIATQERQEMNIFQFCRAIEIVQQKSSINPQAFATEILHVNDHLSARNRMRVMKVNFSGPKTNFFIQSTLTQKERESEKKQYRQFKQKEKEYILHQGMFKQQIQLNLMERKNKRKQRQQNIRNYSAIQNTSRSLIQDNAETEKQKQRQRIRKQPLIKVNNTKSFFQNYSKIFETKKTNKIQYKANTSLIQKKLNDKNLTSRQSKSRLKYQQEKLNHDDELTRQQVQKQIDLLKQRYKIQADSDAESDDILKSHFHNEKRIRSNTKQKENGEKYQDQEDSDMMITKYN